MSRRLGAAAAVLLLWLAVLTFAFHGYYGGRLGSARRRNILLLQHPALALHLPTRKMLLAVASFDDASSPSSLTTTDRHHHHHRHHGHHHHRGHDRWNRKGVPPTAAGPGEEVDPRFGVQKRLVPTGPNPLHH
ncbi:protein FON2 SPARE1 [Oryza glaberrima]|uniref:FON2 SPARE1 n=2 Tax=Oryza TaxID=4527 RepID=A0A0D3F4F9_9ORYZ|nr:protein FON2 SPARE1 [Oryza glaberrima]BAI45210.1 FON2 SPARE1 [Oryza glaberrima]